MKTLTVEITINAPRTVAWANMLGAESYKAWTLPFCEGPCFVGSWDKGAKIHCLAPSGGGMTSVIAENTLQRPSGSYTCSTPTPMRWRA